MSTLLPCYVLLDLETIGATPTQDRITEIGLIRYENGFEVGRWNTLINPDVSVSPFIQRLTGTTQTMVNHAPTFSQVCETLLQWLYKDPDAQRQGQIRSKHQGERQRSRLPHRSRQL